MVDWSPWLAVKLTGAWPTATLVVGRLARWLKELVGSTPRLTGTQNGWRVAVFGQRRTLMVVATAKTRPGILTLALATPSYKGVLTLTKTRPGVLTLALAPKMDENIESCKPPKLDHAY
jgi:hypothetical protein